MNKTERLRMRITKKQKDYIVKQSKKEGYQSMSAFFRARAFNSLHIELDDRPYFELVDKVKAKGTVINNTIRDIRFNSFYSKKDINRIESELSNIKRDIENFEIGNHLIAEKQKDLSISELNKLLKENNHFTLDSLELTPKVNLARSLLSEWINLIEHEGIDDFELDYFYNFGRSLSVDPKVTSLEYLAEFIKEFENKLIQVKEELYHPDKIIADQYITDMFEITRTYYESLGLE